ncbi:hypothetical protein ACFLWA_00850 [Chloroflexota bacterium]
MVQIEKRTKWYLLLVAGVLTIAGSLLVIPARRPAEVRAAGCWQGMITRQWPDYSLYGSVLRVSVEGIVGLPVKVFTREGYATLNFTGTKPEYGPFVAEYAPQHRGTYYIEPEGLGTVFEVWLDGKNYTRVDFYPCVSVPPGVPAPTRTPTPVTVPAPTSLPAPTHTAYPPAPTQVATSIPLPVPTRTPYVPAPTQPPPLAAWQGRIVEHTKNPSGAVYFASIAVKVIDRPPGQEVQIRSNGWSSTATTGTKPEYGPDALEFGGLNPATYLVSPEGLDTAAIVTVERGDFVLIEFYPTGISESAMATAMQTHWAGSEVANLSGDEPTGASSSAVAVVVAGQPWHEVEISSNGWSATALTGYKPEYGPDAAEFGALRAGTYTITPKDLGTSIDVTVDGWAWAMVRFDELPGAPAQDPLPAPTPLPTPSARPTQPAARAVASVQPGPASETPRWQGRVVSNDGGQPGTGISSVIIVHTVNFPGVLVTITGGGTWSATCVTGSKPEYGPNACEFGGLWTNTYYVRPEGADEALEVEMDGHGTAVVEFTLE